MQGRLHSRARRDQYGAGTAIDGTHVDGHLPKCVGILKVTVERVAPSKSQWPGRADLKGRRRVVRVVFTGSGACSLEGSQRRVRWPSSVDLGVDVECRLVV